MYLIAVLALMSAVASTDIQDKWFCIMEIKNKDIAIAVYNDLRKLKMFSNVQYAYEKALDLLYVTAKKQDSETQLFFIPISAKEQMSAVGISSTIHTLCKDKEEKSIIMAVKETESVIEYYKIAEGLALPAYTGNAEEQKKSLMLLRQVVSLLGNKVVPDNAAIQLPYKVYPDKQDPEEKTSNWGTKYKLFCEFPVTTDIAPSLTSVTPEIDTKI